MTEYWVINLTAFTNVYNGASLSWDISKCPRRVPLCIEVSLEWGVPLYMYRGVGCSTVYKGVFISGCWNRGILLYTEVYSFQGVGIEGFYYIQRCIPFSGLE